MSLPLPQEAESSDDLPEFLFADLFHHENEDESDEEPIPSISPAAGTPGSLEARNAELQVRQPHGVLCPVAHLNVGLTRRH